MPGRFVSKEVQRGFRLTRKEREHWLIRRVLASRVRSRPEPNLPIPSTSETSEATTHSVANNNEQYEFHIRDEGRDLRRRIVDVSALFSFAGEHITSPLKYVEAYFNYGSDIIGNLSADQDIAPAVAMADLGVVVQQVEDHTLEGYLPEANLLLETPYLHRYGVVWQPPTEEEILAKAKTLSRSRICMLTSQELMRELSFDEFHNDDNDDHAHVEGNFLFPDDYKKIVFNGWEFCYGYCWMQEFELSEHTVRIMKMLKANMLV
ncbi:predicted protein [Naegleria gruberi]|uniref:Predicted protein n=1 Tax=Naegleria gruberi TaxID=5762 RepID=D2VS31_NAEGR|nr:uncharacterized protein NAEGRDRAFT_71794 [Naegleria gruberi]EFC40349.1 predicted protein [Naegleria gruberi]|eukprot:XP_002673093.1 predicted protein [Naegleria gruberi strain NEG-M]